MIEATGDLFSAEIINQADAICITTNGQVKKNGLAVMGAGVAKQAANRWGWLQGVLAGYLQTNGNHAYFLGTTGDVGSCALVSFPTKNHWKDKSSILLIRRSVTELRMLADAKGWNKVFLTRPGCGNGGLSWGYVKPFLISAGLDDRFTVLTPP